MLPSLFSLAALLSYFTLISSLALETRNSWRFSHGLPPARPRRFHSSATETAHRRSTSSIPLMVDGGDFESSSSTSPWTGSGQASTVSWEAYTGNGAGCLVGGSTEISSLTSSITGLTPSSVYTLSYWTKVTYGPASSCTVSALVDGIPVPGASKVFGAIPPNTWIQVTGKFTATAATESIVLQKNCPKYMFDVVYVDDVIVSMV
ncbi:hypothetical protein DL96DRAFT_201475 [Flagelloscypha sp. PMI_526]|nr:hypothetical protein DL96DRAFT_201475 [Flagelloscypha sp. PMI_526]